MEAGGGNLVGVVGIGASGTGGKKEMMMRTKVKMLSLRAKKAILENNSGVAGQELQEPFEMGA